MQKTLDQVLELAGREQYLAVVATLRTDGTIQQSLVNAGAAQHPITGERVLAFVTYGPAKLRNLRRRPALSATFRSGWAWGALDGVAELVGPDDPLPGVDAERLRLLLREIFTAAGGKHDDWPAYDAAMIAERRVAVLVRPTRIYG